MSSGNKTKKTGTNAETHRGRGKQPRKKASKPPARTNSGSATREDTGSNDEASSRSSKTIWTSSNTREFEATPSTTSSGKAGHDVEQLCARCHREMDEYGSPSIDNTLVPWQNRKFKGWLYPAAVVVSTIAVVTVIYMVLHVTDAGNSEPLDDVVQKQGEVPASEYPCDPNPPAASCDQHERFTPTADSGEEDTGVLAEEPKRLKIRKIRRRRRRRTSGTISVPLPKNTNGTTTRGRGVTSPLPLESKPKGSTTGDSSGTTLENFPSETTRGAYATPNIVLEVIRPGTEATVATPFLTTSSLFATLTKPEALVTPGVSGKMTSESGEQQSKSALTSSLISVGSSDEKASTKAPFAETSAESDWEVQQPLDTPSDAEIRPAGTTNDMMALLANVGVQDSAPIGKHARRRGGAKRQAALSGSIRTRTSSASATLTVIRH